MLEVVELLMAHLGAALYYASIALIVSLHCKRCELKSSGDLPGD